MLAFSSAPYEIDPLLFSSQSKLSSSLDSLNLSFNFFHSSIPQSISNLSKITELYLNSNQLFSEIPNSLGNLSFLRKLYLNDNQLFSTIRSHSIQISLS